MASSAPPAEDDVTTPRLGLDVLSWRFGELERAGYPGDIAVMLAEDATVDLHVACGLLVGGATVHQALRILT